MKNEMAKCPRVGKKDNVTNFGGVEVEFVKAVESGVINIDFTSDELSSVQTDK